jgi:hypothetical protein
MYHVPVLYPIRMCTTSRGSLSGKGTLKRPSPRCAPQRRPGAPWATKISSKASNGCSAAPSRAARRDANRGRGTPISQRCSSAH